MSIAAAPPISIRAALIPVTALLIATAFLFMGHGLQQTLVPLRANEEGFSDLAIGILGSVYYAGFTAGCLFVPFLILRSGHIRAFAAMVSLLSAAVLAFPLAVNEPQWLVFRLIVGFCLSGLSVIIESWLNEKSTNQTRGTVMSAYIVVTYGALSLGQLGVAAQPISGFSLFALCSIVLSLAAIPVALTRATQPAPIAVVKFRPRSVVLIAPAAFFGTFVSGIAVGAIFSLGTIYAVGSGFSQTDAALFMSAFVVGGAIGQYPFGRLSDFVDRRLVMLGAVSGGGAVCLLLLAGPVLPNSVILAMGFAGGAMILPIYSLACAHAYDWTEHEDLVEVSSALVLFFGIGSTIGPLIASAAMGMMGPAGLFIVALSALGLLGAFVFYRMFVRKRPTEEQRGDFDIYSTSVLGGAVTPEAFGDDEPLMETPAPFPPRSAEPDGTNDAPEAPQMPETSQAEVQNRSG